MSATARIHRREDLGSEEFAALLAGAPRDAARAVLAAAETGLLEAQLLLGQLLLDGCGIARDPALALTWFRIAAERGHPMGWNMLGRCLENGWGCSKDLPGAAQAYAQAAAGGLDWGMYNQANLLATGRGVARDPAAAFVLYRQAAELGHAKSMNLVGRCYEDGQGVAADPRSAYDWYRRSAEAGDFRGQFSHAAVLLGQGQVETARRWLLQALEGGNLNFLRVAAVQLEDVALPALADITEAYRQRRRELEACAASDAASPVALAGH